MSEQIKFTVLGEPRAQKRHRSVRIDNGIRNYDPSASDKQDFKMMAYAHRPEKPLDQPLRVDITFYFGRPKSHYRTGANSHILKPNAPLWHTSKPDRDNCDKGTMDSLKGVFWRDDSIICAGEIIKQYSENPRVEVVITLL